MSRINWGLFLANSTSADALIDFAYDKATAVELIAGCWDKAARKEARRVKHMPSEHARKLARKALERQGLIITQ